MKMFRVAEDGTLADMKDAEYKLPKGATVSVLHPIRMEKRDIDAWSAVFGEYRILQPFPQLARPVFAPTEQENSAHALERFRGKKTSYGALRGLEGRGWKKWRDDSVVFARPVTPKEYATLDTEPGWHPSMTADEVEEQTVGDLHLHDTLITAT